MCVICSSAILHPVHISYTKIHIAHDTLQCITKIYEHDIAYVLGDEWKQLPQNKIEEIYNRMVQCYANNNYVFLQLDSTKVEGEFYWLYAHSMLSSDYDSVMYTNSILCDIFEEQKNLSIISVNAHENGHVLDCKNQNITITLY
ncbi:MAG: DUF6702 family protein [Bacteroidales bacterium]